MEYDGRCGTCLEFKDKRNCRDCFDIKYANSEKGYCDYYRSYYWADDSCDHYKNNGRSNSSSCYITTIICNKLNYSDDAGVLNTLRGFRDNVMQKDIKYCKLLFEYDVIGPKIAQMIQEDNNTDIELWIQFYNFYLSQTANFILDKKYDDAVTLYTQMITDLKEYYGIREDMVEITKEYDMSKGGHGKVKKISTI